MYRKQLITVPGGTLEKEATLYLDEGIPSRAMVFYLHGGGLLYGSREDLPESHLMAFTSAGFPVLALDYPLAPAVKLPGILNEIKDSIEYFLAEREALFGSSLPFVLFGRSAGGWLALLACRELSGKPAALVSYYGYGLLTDGWMDTESSYYKSLPAVPESCLTLLPQAPHCSGPLETHYSAYVYARQKGEWKHLIYEGRDKYFLRDYTLRLTDSLPCPLFAAHSMKDDDVPYSEFLALCDRYSPRKFLAAGTCHDFDREDNDLTRRLLAETMDFLDGILSAGGSGLPGVRL